MEPDRVPLGTKRMPKKQVYHFLLGDPGMCSYSDKVIKQLEPANIKAMKDWNKKFTGPVNDDDIVTLLATLCRRLMSCGKRKFGYAKKSMLRHRILFLSLAILMMQRIRIPRFVRRIKSLANYIRANI